MSRSRQAAMAALRRKLTALYGAEIAQARMARIVADAAIWNSMERACA